MIEILPHLGLVKSIASSVFRRTHISVEMDDLIQDGSIGLMKACERFDPQKGIPFDIYAQKMIRWEIIAGLRGRDFLSRTQRKNNPAAKSFSLSDPESSDAEYFESASGAKEINSVFRIDETMLRSLDGRCRTILRLRFEESSTIRQIAHIFQMSEATIAADIRRSLRAIKARFDDETKIPPLFFCKENP
jgi:RNA polymerase sigma factor (sigma-70 family)